MTDEEKAPDPRVKFREAVEELLLFYNDDGSVLSNWVLVTAETRIVEDGKTETSLSTIIDEYQGIHITAGLLQYAVARNVNNIKHMRKGDDDS